MDPISIASTVLGITSQCLKCAKILNNLRQTYSNAAITISALGSETAIVSASLSQMQMMLLQNPETFKTELLPVFDTAITGCSVTFSCLYSEVVKLAAGDSSPGQEPGFKAKVRVVWNNELMNELLLHIRGQQTALTLLLQLLHMQSMSEITGLLRTKTRVFQQAASEACSLRDAHPELDVPESIFEHERDDSGSTIRNLASTIDDREFTFDDIIVNSKSYRRALAAVQTSRYQAAQRTVIPTMPFAEKSNIRSQLNTEADLSAPFLLSSSDRLREEKISNFTEADCWTGYKISFGPDGDHKLTNFGSSAPVGMINSCGLEKTRDALYLMTQPLSHSLLRYPRLWYVVSMENQVAVCVEIPTSDGLVERTENLSDIKDGQFSKEMKQSTQLPPPRWKENDFVMKWPHLLMFNGPQLADGRLDIHVLLGNEVQFGTKLWKATFDIDSGKWGVVTVFPLPLPRPLKSTFLATNKEAYYISKDGLNYLDPSKEQKWECIIRWPVDDQAPVGDSKPFTFYFWSKLYVIYYPDTYSRFGTIVKLRGSQPVVYEFDLRTRTCAFVECIWDFGSFLSGPHSGAAPLRATTLSAVGDEMVFFTAENVDRLHPSNRVLLALNLLTKNWNLVPLPSSLKGRIRGMSSRHGNLILFVEEEFEVLGDRGTSRSLFLPGKQKLWTFDIKLAKSLGKIN
ncbi:hypothetical protein G7Y89_g9827 [Cudoniella acicularis]|uniref:Uncharacterized protein n=1 Tax=Cudoniella acicularis TaxID=354080 RepID=A0A8H4W273_9HELO|nr:hypothetical protein G7Y89_g9827 [Cudoniella acicularis]